MTLMQEKIEKSAIAAEKVGGNFKLCVLLQKRVRQLVGGSPPLVKVTADMSPIDIALDEVIEGKISLSDRFEVEAKKAATRQEKSEEKKPRTKARTAKKKS